MNKLLLCGLLAGGILVSGLTSGCNKNGEKEENNGTQPVVAVSAKAVETVHFEFCGT